MTVDIGWATTRELEHLAALDDEHRMAVASIRLGFDYRTGRPPKGQRR